MTRRHPRQVLDPAAFRTGDKYVLIRAKESPDSPRRTFISHEEMVFAEALDNGNAAAAEEAIGRHPAEGRSIRFTTHEIEGHIVIASWRWDDVLQDNWAFANMDSGFGRHAIFVPAADWAADPRLHVVDWVNPHEVCEAGLTWAEEEAMLRKRRDAAMRRSLGFE